MSLLKRALHVTWGICFIVLGAANGFAQILLDASPAPTRLPSSRFVKFHFSFRLPANAIGLNHAVVGFESPGGKRCRVLIAEEGSIQAAPDSVEACSVGPGAKLEHPSRGIYLATVPIALRNRGAHTLQLRVSYRTPSRKEVEMRRAVAGSYQVEGDAVAPLDVSVLGVTPTQAVLSFTPPDSNACTVQVTSTHNDTGWDYNQLVPDTDPNVFRGAGNAELFDPVGSPSNRGFLQPDGSRAIVIGKRVAEYSPYTTTMKSRALQAATAHEAIVACGAATGVIDFTTANIMPGVSYQDTIPADPDRPGDYLYPTLSWSNRGDSVVDPQTGLRIYPVTLPADQYLSDYIASAAAGDIFGKFGAPVAAYPNRSLPAPSFFLPANISDQTTGWWGFRIDQTYSGWIIPDNSLNTFLPSSLTIGCPLCNHTQVTVCLTADGFSCATDRNLRADPNSPVDGNTRQRGILGFSFDCTGNCSIPVSDSRWTSPPPVLGSWHPNYTQGSTPVVVPDFQSDSVKKRFTKVTCDGSSLVRRMALNGNPQGAAFNPLWIAGTPVTIDSTRFTISKVIDENNVQVKESCPSDASTMTADTFGLLFTAPVPLTGVAGAQWKATLSGGVTTWDATGSIEAYTNCSEKPVMAFGKAGWHCTIGEAGYWIAADGTLSIPIGILGISSSDLGPNPYCVALWDESDGNSYYCLAYSTTPGLRTIARMTFHGDYTGLDKRIFTNSSQTLPICRTLNPVAPNNCWELRILNKTGTNSHIVVENEIRAGAQAAWDSSAFAGALPKGEVSTSMTTRIDPDHMLLATWLSQNSYGFLSVLELSSDRTSASVKAVLPSWTGPANQPPGSKALRWAGYHTYAVDVWSPTKLMTSPTYFRTGPGNGNGPYLSKVVTSTPIGCPSGVAGVCLSITIDGQPGDPSPGSYEKPNDAKTNKPGFGYLQDLAPGDLICAPLNDSYGACVSYIGYESFEYYQVMATSTLADGTVALVVQRGIGRTATISLAKGQTLYAMPNSCQFDSGYACAATPALWDYQARTVEMFSVGGSGHQFATFDRSTNQMVSVTAGSDKPNASVCYDQSAAGNVGTCYGVIAGWLDPTKPVAGQLSNLAPGLLNMNPPFASGTATGGYTGLGVPNAIDSHPGAHHLTAAPNSEKIWFADARPFNGLSDRGFPAPVAVPSMADVYRFTTSDPNIAIESYKRLPIMGSCGMQVLRDVTRISTQTPYSYCVSISGGDCTSDSNPGDVYVSCPKVNPAAKAQNSCPYAGIGAYTPEVRDTCLMTAGPYAMGLTQVAFASQKDGVWSSLPPSLAARSTRLLTHGLSRYRIVDQFWNPKTTPDGRVLLFRAGFVNGYSTQVLMAPLPPFPDIAQDPLDRRSYIPAPVSIDAPPDGARAVKIQFGYNEKLECIARNEICEARADLDPTGLSTPFYFASEAGPDGLPCDAASGSCPSVVNLPGISQRVIYYRLVYLTDGGPISSPIRIAAVPDPFNSPN